MYLPAIVSVKFSTSLKLEVPPVNVALLIVILEKSESQEDSIPWAERAFIKSWMVMSLVTLIVLSSPLILNIAVPFPPSPIVSKVVFKVALIVLVIDFVNICVLEYAEATLIWSVEIVPAPYKHSSKLVPFIYLGLVSAMVKLLTRCWTSESDKVLKAPPVISKIPLSVSKVE